MMKKSILKVVLGAVFCLPLVLTSCNDVFGQMDNASTETKLTVTYYVWDPTEQKLVEKTSTDDVNVITSSTTSWSGLCFVNENVTIDGDVTLAGDVTLVVADGVKLTVNGQVVNAQYNLSLYGQKEKTGQFVVGIDDAGIAMETKGLEIGGLKVNVKATTGAGYSAIRTHGKTAIYDGEVTASGYHGIYVENNDDVEIYGGTVNLTSHAQALWANHLTISGGTVNATGDGSGGEGVINCTNVLIKNSVKEIKITNTTVTTDESLDHWLNGSTSLVFGTNASVTASSTDLAEGGSLSSGDFAGFTVTRGSDTEKTIVTIKPNA